jgi:preprotein translocase subunit SecF
MQPQVSPFLQAQNTQQQHLTQQVQVQEQMQQQQVQAQQQQQQQQHETPQQQRNYSTLQAPPSHPSQAHHALAIPGKPVMVRLLVMWLRLKARVLDSVYVCHQHHIALAIPGGPVMVGWLVS